MEILGIAFVEGDEKGKRWLREFLERHDVTWPNVPTRPYWYGEPFEDFNVRYIPFNLLIDSEGRVLATDVRGLRLDAAVAQALGGE